MWVSQCEWRFSSASRAPGGLRGRARAVSSARRKRPLNCMLLTQTGLRSDHASSRSAFRMAGRRELRMELCELRMVELRELRVLS